MYLNEANPGDTIVIQNLNKIDPPRRNGLRDMGLYERGIVYIDQKDDESIHFHKRTGVYRPVADQCARGDF